MGTVFSQPENLAYRRMFHPLYRQRMQRFNNPGPFDNDARPFNNNRGPFNNDGGRTDNNRRPFNNNRGPFNNNRGPPPNFGRRFHPLNRRRPPPSFQQSNPLHDMDFMDVLRLLLRQQLFGGLNLGGFNGSPRFQTQPTYAMYEPMDGPDAPDAPDPTQRRGRGRRRGRQAKT